MATIIPLEGEFDDAVVGVWTALVELLGNASIEAHYPSIDHQISLASIDVEEEEKKGVFKKLFNRDSKAKKDDKIEN